MPRRLLPAMIGLVILVAARPALAEPPIWVVKQGHATVVLFGSVHVLPPRLDWEPKRLKAALAKADDLWFEIPLDGASDVAAAHLAQQRGLQPAGQSLSGELSPAGRERLARITRRCGMTVADLDRLRPWLADITLSLAVYSQVGAEADAGVERQIARSAPPTIARHAFETVEQQIDILSGASTADQVASLEETLDELDKGADSYEQIVTVWMAGDARGIVHEALDPVRKDAPGVYRSLVVERNQRWVDAILQRLKGQGEAVMVVGVGHLVGPDGVPALLRAKGVSVDGP